MIKRPKVLKSSFAGHESFPLRYAWLKKGYDAIQRDPAIFSKEHAMTDLGVGKNMVRGIRHWGLATGMWTASSETRGRDVKPTSLGRRLLEKEGWDPYMDDVGTLWLLHWLLTRQPDVATTFWLLFSRQKPGVFSKDDLLEELRGVAAEADGGRDVPDSTLERDVAVAIRCYTRSRVEREESLEDAINCPLMALELLRPEEGQRGKYLAPLGPRPSLPPQIFDAALLDWCGRLSAGKERAISFEEALYGWGSPGRSFRLTEATLMDRLSVAVQKWGPHLRFDETIGMRQLLVSRDLPRMDDILEQYYRPAATAVAA